MSDTLSRILAYKRTEVEAARARLPEEELVARAEAAPPPRGFARALAGTAEEGRPALIAEVKKASPSKGLIRADFDPVAIARAYEAGGATCLSVLTDEPSFQGTLSDMTAAREATGLPVLRKDFFIDPYQVAEARAAGADAILVILAALDDDTARLLVEQAARFGMDALLEVHDERELQRALALPAHLVGINNRNLRTFETDLAVSERLSALVPDDRLTIAESGIFTHADVVRLRGHGIGAFLVGESLMREADVAAATRRLLTGAADGPAGLTHVAADGSARMVDVSDKAESRREAVAEGRVRMAAGTLEAIRAGDVKKGDVLGTARIAGIMAAKRTHELVPLCHPLPVSKVEVSLEPDGALPGIAITARVAVTGRTGVEMEALTAVSVAALTVYDMAKALDRSMTIEGVRLLRKSGGRSGDWRAD